MKIFMGSDFDGVANVKIILKGKEFTLLRGKRNTEHRPVYGAEFPNDDEFIGWILHNFGKKEIE